MQQGFIFCVCDGLYSSRWLYRATVLIKAAKQPRVLELLASSSPCNCSSLMSVQWTIVFCCLLFSWDLVSPAIFHNRLEQLWILILLSSGLGFLIVFLIICFPTLLDYFSEVCSWHTVQSSRLLLRGCGLVCAHSHPGTVVLVGLPLIPFPWSSLISRLSCLPLLDFYSAVSLHLLPTNCSIVFGSALQAQILLHSDSLKSGLLCWHGFRELFFR